MQGWQQKCLGWLGFEDYIYNTYRDIPLRMAIEMAAYNGVNGSYYEFGVFNGRSFIRCYHWARRFFRPDVFSHMKFVAFDSFEGLPETHDTFAPRHFKKGAYKAPLEQFLKKLKQAKIDLNKLVVIPGFYNTSLSSPETLAPITNDKIAVAYIDCDIYESAVDVFRFITPRLQMGTVIVVDDWFRHHAHPQHGIQKAYYDWLAANPHIKTTPLVCSDRMAFFVHLDAA